MNAEEAIATYQTAVEEVFKDGWAEYLTKNCIDSSKSKIRICYFLHTVPFPMKGYFSFL